MNQSTAGSVLFTARRIMQLLFGVIGCLYSETLPNLVTSKYTTLCEVEWVGQAI